MTAFEPIGEEARWRPIYELFKAAPIGSVVTYDALATAIDVDPLKERHIIHASARQASKHHLRDDDRATETVTNVGYRIVEPTEQLRLAKNHLKKSRRSLVRGHDTTVHVDFNGMDPEVRKGFEVTGQVIGALLDYTRRVGMRQDRQEAGMVAIMSRQEATEDRLAQLEAWKKAHGG